MSGPRHTRSAVRPGWRRQADSLLAGGLVLLLLAGAATVLVVTVPVVAAGQALVHGDTVLVVLTGDAGDGVGPGTRVSVVWGTDSDRVDGTVRKAGKGAGALREYDLPGQLAGGGDVLVAEADVPPPDASAGPSGTATAYVGRRPLIDLFLGRGVEQ